MRERERENHLALLDHSLTNTQQGNRSESSFLAYRAKNRSRRIVI